MEERRLELMNGGENGRSDEEADGHGGTRADQAEEKTGYRV